MPDPTTNGAPGDDVLTAYLDGELSGEEKAAVEARLASDAETKARLDALGRASRPYGDAFALVLEAAPRERLVAMVPTARVPVVAAEVAPRRVWITAAAVVLFMVGVAIGAISRPTEAPVPAAPARQVAAAPVPPPSWRQAVAEYLVLTTPDTLAVLPDNPRLAEAVAVYGAKLHLDVSTDRLAMPMAVLKDVRLYDYRGRALVQASYLSDDRMAIAFCIIVATAGAADAPPTFEQREGENIVFWVKDGHGFMVAGKVPRETIEALAKDFSARFI